MTRKLSGISADDKAAAGFWFDGPASFTANAAQDRRQLLNRITSALAVIDELLSRRPVRDVSDALQSVRFILDDPPED